MQHLRVNCTLTLHHVIEFTPKRSDLGVQYRTHRCKQKKRRMLECCRQDTKEAMNFMDHKYGFIELTNNYQINHTFRTFPQKRIMQLLNLGVVRLPILHTFTRDGIIILRKNLI